MLFNVAILRNEGAFEIINVIQGTVIWIRQMLADCIA